MNACAMFAKLYIYFQYLLPQHLLTQLFGWAAESHVRWIKNLLIKRFIHHYQVNLQEALYTDIAQYPTFNAFFIRKLHPAARKIDDSTNSIVSPADGIVTQFGEIRENTLLQAKSFYFDLESLFGGSKENAFAFTNGTFATFYLAPKDYHRVHIPLAGKLVQTIFIPGSLFAVNPITSQHVPQLYVRNERLVTCFSTDIGRVAVIFIGAMIVSSIQTTWVSQPYQSPKILAHDFTEGPRFKKGDELGFFKMGSTVILLFEKNKVSPLSLTCNSEVHLGEKIGCFL